MFWKYKEDETEIEHHVALVQLAIQVVSWLELDLYVNLNFCLVYHIPTTADTHLEIHLYKDS